MVGQRGGFVDRFAGEFRVAEMKEGERTVMEYLLSPVRKSLHEAARER